MDEKALRLLVQNSPVLTPPEKTYWLENMSKLTPADKTELENILTTSGKGFDQSMQKLFEVLTPALESSLAALATVPL